VAFTIALIVTALILYYYKLKLDALEKQKKPIKKRYANLNNHKKEANRQNRKKIFEENRKKRTKELYKKNKIKGDNYELFTGEHYKLLGYKVKQRGIILNYKDGGIDIVAKKDNQILLIQCKNIKKDSKDEHMMNIEIVKKFNDNCLKHINKEKIQLKDTTFIFTISNKESITNEAVKYLEQYDNNCELEILEFHEQVKKERHNYKDDIDKEITTKDIYKDLEEKVNESLNPTIKDKIIKEEKVYTIKQTPENIEEILKQSEARYKKRYEDKKLGTVVQNI